jgi:hypothetical protein
MEMKTVKTVKKKVYKLKQLESYPEAGDQFEHIALFGILARAPSKHVDIM